MGTARRRHGRWLGLLMALPMFGCVGKDPTEPSVRDLATMFARVALNHRAIVLSVHAPYDTVQLNAIALDIRGKAIENGARVTFRRAHVLDTAISVDEDGFVRARMRSPGTTVIAEMTIEGITRADTAIIMVRTESPVVQFSRLEFFPLSPDSAWRWAGSLDEIKYRGWVRAFDVDGNSVSANELSVYFDLGDRAIFSAQGLFLPPGGFKERSRFPAAVALIGETWLTASTYVYGVRLSDSMLFRRITPPVRFIVVDRIVRANGQPSIVFYPASLEVDPGTTIAFINRWGLSTEDPYAFGEYFCFVSFCGNRITRATMQGNVLLQYVDSVDVTFAGPVPPSSPDVYSGIRFFKGVAFAIASDTASGDIEAFSVVVGTWPPLDEGVRARKFVTPGTYRFSSSRFPDAGGQIVVRE